MEMDPVFDENGTEAAVIENMMQIVCFRLDDEEYAIPIVDIREVIKSKKITLVPQMPDFVLGVMNLRGNVIAVFDIKKMLKLPPRELDDRVRFIILSSQTSLFGIVVDEILDTIKISTSSLDSLPERKMNIKKECVKGVGILEKRMVVILDVNKINEELMLEIEAFRQQK